jgi:hypothetical protein
LLVVGPAIISSGSESWRMFWLFGSRSGSAVVEESTNRVWLLLSSLYFAAVVGGAVYFLRQRRAQTAIYNVTPEAFEKAFGQVLNSLGLNPLRSGSLFVFGAFRPLGSSRTGHALEASLASTGVAVTAAEKVAVAVCEPEAESAVLEVDFFRAMRHVTLRWEPRDARVRDEVESELARTLAQAPTLSNPVGDWMLLAALAMIAFNLLMTFGLAIANFIRR